MASLLRSCMNILSASLSLLIIFFSTSLLFAQKQDKVKIELFYELDTELEECRMEEVPLFAPNLFQKAEEISNRAKTFYAKGKNLQKIKKEIAQAMKTLREAKKNARVSNVLLEEVYDVHKNLSHKEYIQLARKEFSHAEKRFKNAIYKAEAGNTKDALKEAEKAMKDYRQMAIVVLEKGILQKAFSELKKSKKMIPQENYKQKEVDLKKMKDRIPKSKDQEFNISSLISEINIKVNQILGIEVEYVPPHLTFSRVEYTPSLPKERTNWYVGKFPSLKAKPSDGSREYPFPTIASALEAAESKKVRGLNLYVQKDDYRAYSEQLRITRDIVMVAVGEERPVISGSIINTTPALLSITGFRLSGAQDGAICVSNRNARTILTDVVIDRAKRFGIYQIGGHLTLSNVQIYYTDRTRDSSYYHYGAGLIISSGCSGSLTNVLIEGNQSSGIIVRGSGTCLDGNGVEIKRNYFNRNFERELVQLAGLPLPSYPTGAITVEDGAVATLSDLRMIDNEFISLEVQRDGRAYLSNVLIQGTSKFVPTGGWPADHFFGADPWRISFGAGWGIFVRLNGYVEVRNFTITRNDMGGVGLFTGGEMDLYDGKVTYNGVCGAAVFTEGFNIKRLSNNVRYHNNPQDLNTGGTLPVPDSSLPPME